MRKIILVGEFALNIVFDASRHPLGTLPGGRIVTSAAMLAADGLPVSVVGEASADAVGDMAVEYLLAAGADTGCVDRFNEGVTPTQLHFPRKDKGGYDVIRYEEYPEECFDVMWPRLDPADIVVFGGFLTIDPRARERVLQFLNMASERKCVMVYLPGFLPSRMPRITRVMPSILENLEMSSIVVTRSSDLNTIFGTSDDARAFAQNISFYAPRMINVDASARQIRALATSVYESAAIASDSCASLLWNSAATAGVVEYIYRNLPTQEDVAQMSGPQMREMLALALARADKYVAAVREPWKLSI